jgi:hypothetical protein
MPLIKISSTHVTQRCANCNSIHSIAVASLTLGHELNRHAIHLPPCVCGAQEILVPQLDAPESNERSHRKAVNALALALKSAGRVREEQADEHARDRTPIDLMELGAEVEVAQTKSGELPRARRR